MKKSVEELIKQINKKFGDNSAARFGSFPTLKNVDCVSTGSISLDLALGVGGLPRGRIVEIYGPEASGKTTLALTIAREAQKRDFSVAYIDVEHALDPAYSRTLGVVVDDLIISQPDSGEEALNIVQEYVDSGEVEVIIVDSVAALLPKAEEEGNIGDQLMGTKARLMSQAMRKLVPAISKSNTLVIFINQIRAKMGVMTYGGETTTTPGGYALKFASSVRLDIRTVAKVKNGDEVIGNNVKVKVTKNKVAPPFKLAEFMIEFGKGIAYELDVVQTGLLYGVLKKDGNTYFYKDTQLGVGVNNSKKKLESEPELVKQIVADLMKDEEETQEQSSDSEETKRKRRRKDAE